MTEKAFTLHKLTSDMEISTRIYYQYCLLKDAVQLEKPQKHQLISCLIDVMKKLEALKYHKDRISELSKKLFEESGDGEKEGGSYIMVDHTTGIETEFEAFLLQGKSCLDVLVKILKPLLSISLVTYGKSGSSVIRALENNLPDGEKETAVPLLEMLKEDMDWIKEWFKSVRDGIAHYRSLESSGHMKFKPRDGEHVHRLPTDKSGASFTVLSDMLYHNMLTFCEDFIPLAMSIKFLPAIVLGPAARSEQEFLQVKYGLYMTQS